MPNNVPNEKYGLYTLISKIILFVIYTLVALFNMALSEQT